MSVPQSVIDQAEEIRQAGPVNMMDSKGVQYFAHAEDFYDLVNWIEDHPGEWWEVLEQLGKGDSE